MRGKHWGSWKRVESKSQKNEIQEPQEDQNTRILTKSLCNVGISPKAAKLNTTCQPLANCLSIFFPASASSHRELVFRLMHLSLPSAICPANEVQLRGLLS